MEIDGPTCNVLRRFSTSAIIFVVGVGFRTLFIISDVKSASLSSFTKIALLLVSINGSIVCLYDVVTTELFVNDGERDERILRLTFFSASSAAATKSSSDASAKYETGSGATDRRLGDFGRLGDFDRTEIYSFKDYTNFNIILIFYWN